MTSDDPRPADDALLAAYHAGDAAAFGELARRHVGWVFAVARRRTGDVHAAEDLTQAALLALAARRTPVREASMAPWLFGVVRNLAAKHHRSAGRRARHEAAAARQAIHSPAASGDQDLATVLDELLARLPADDAAAVLLRFYEKRSHADVGRALGVGEEAARKRVDRAVDKLRALFAERGVTAESVVAGLAVVGSPPPPPGLAERVALRAVVRPTATTLRKGPIVLGVAAAVLAGVVIAVRPTPEPPPVAVSRPAPTTQAARSATRPSSLTLAELAARLQETEQKLENVTVLNFRTVTSLGPSPNGPWRETPEMSMGRAWFDNRPDGRVRIDYAWEARRWTDGAAPYAADSQTIAWDGQTGRKIWYMTGPFNKPFRIDRYSTYDKRPPSLNYVGDTGVNLLLNFAGSEADAKLTLGEALAEGARLLGNAPPAFIRIDLVDENVDGLETVRLSVQNVIGGQGGMSQSTWFVPSRGYAVLKKEDVHVVDTNKPRDDPENLRSYLRLAVLEAAESEAGVWTVTAAERVVLSPAFADRPREFRRTVFTADAMIANDPLFDPALFSPAIPDGFIKDQ